MIKINRCTPAPWTVVIVKDDDNQTIGHGVYGSNGDKVLFIDTPNYRHIDEIESNLALIGAAPQLYEALRLMHNEFIDFKDESQEYRTEAFAAAEAAIKKADQGES